MKTPYMRALKRPPFSCLMKKDTVMGTMGNTHGVRSMRKPHRMASRMRPQRLPGLTGHLHRHRETVLLRHLAIIPATSAPHHVSFHFELAGTAEQELLFEHIRAHHYRIPFVLRGGIFLHRLPVRGNTVRSGNLQFRPHMRVAHGVHVIVFSNLSRYHQLVTVSFRMMDGSLPYHAGIQLQKERNKGRK